MTGEEHENVEQDRDEESREEDLELTDENAEDVRGGLTSPDRNIDTFKFG